jgi:hypothetical protein
MPSTDICIKTSSGSYCNQTGCRIRWWADHRWVSPLCHPFFSYFEHVPVLTIQIGTWGVLRAQPGTSCSTDPNSHIHKFFTPHFLFLSARSRSRSAAGGAKSIMNMSDDDDDAVSMKSVARYLSLFTLFIIIMTVYLNWPLAPSIVPALALSASQSQSQSKEWATTIHMS